MMPWRTHRREANTSRAPVRESHTCEGGGGRRQERAYASDGARTSGRARLGKWLHNDIMELSANKLNHDNVMRIV